MKILTEDALPGFFARLAESYEVRLPILLLDGTRALGCLGEGPVALRGGRLPGKPTAAFFPHHGPVFTASKGGFEEEAAPARPLFVAGFTHRDLDCLRFIDRFFGAAPADDIYFRRRQGAVIAGVSGYCGPGGSLLPVAGGDCDLEFAWDGAQWLVVPYTEAGAGIAAELPDGVKDETLERLKEASGALPDENETFILRAAALVQADLVPDEFWDDIGERCIACTACNLACPTCTCFGVQDWRYAGQVERSRMWDSCQGFDGFMREASGHNPLGTQGLRTRRRIHHKLAADPQNWGELGCQLCGRCDAVCPTGIGIFAVAREMVEKYEG